jgi:DnaJ-class molecular chaperone
LCIHVLATHQRRRLALTYHPDKAQHTHRAAADAVFQLVAAAYVILSDPEKKEVYDTTRQAWLAKRSVWDRGCGVDSARQSNLRRAHAAAGSGSNGMYSWQYQQQQRCKQQQERDQHGSFGNAAPPFKPGDQFTAWAGHQQQHPLSHQQRPPSQRSQQRQQHYCHDRSETNWSSSSSSSSSSCSTATGVAP